MPIQSSTDDKLPVIIYPASLVFLSDDTSSHQQLLTLYNPYDFTLRYKVLSTAREKYKVLDPEGLLKSRCSIDIVFKYRDVCSSNERVHDKFRIQIMEQGKKTVLGKKDFMSVLLPTAEKPNPLASPADDDFKALPALSSSAPFESKREVEQTQASWWVLMALCLSMAVLLAPLEAEASVLPPFVRVTVHQKCICAYILGLVTMRLIQSS